MMNTSSWAFVFWTAAFVVLLVLLVRSARHGRGVAERTEGIAKEELPAIGEIAEKRHMERFGRPPTGLPTPSLVRSGGRLKSSSWYPQTKTKPKA